MKKNVKLLMSIITLTLTLITFMSSIYGWYVTNKEAEATGLKVTTYDPQLDYELQSYSEETKTYSKYNTMSFSNIAPNDVFYFRFKITPREDDLDVSTLKFNMTFSDYESSLAESTLVYNSTKKIITYDSVKLYSVITDETSGENTVSFGGKTLYKINNNTVTLDKYKIQDTFKVYANQKPSDESLGTGVLLNGIVNTYNGDTNYIEIDNGNYYFYFALEFNEELSLVTDNNIESSNAYEFQKLEISEITIKRVI